MTPNNLDQFSPVKWEEFESVGRPGSAPVTATVFGWLCILAVIGGALWAVNS